MATERMLDVQQRFTWSTRLLVRAILIGSIMVGLNSCLICECQAQYGRSYRLAQMKSQRMASMGFRRLGRARPSPYSIAPMGMRHVMPFRRPLGVRREGVGFSAYSPGQAIRNACHYGRRPMVAHAVVRGRDGYYATVFYR